MPLIEENISVLPVWVPATGEVMLLNEANEIIHVKRYFMAPAIIVVRRRVRKYRVYFIYDEKVIEDLGLCIPLGIETRYKFPFISSIPDFEKNVKRELSSLVDESSRILSSYNVSVNASDPRQVAKAIYKVLWHSRRVIDPHDATILLATLTKLITETGLELRDVVTGENNQGTRRRRLA